jgi:hypothetical protein
MTGNAIPMMGIHEPLCPRCREAHQSRRRLPPYLRLLRALGIRVRLYQCPRCGKRSLTWR